MHAAVSVVEVGVEGVPHLLGRELSGGNLEAGVAIGVRIDVVFKPITNRVVTRQVRWQSLVVLNEAVLPVPNEVDILSCAYLNECALC